MDFITLAATPQLVLERVNAALAAFATNAVMRSTKTKKSEVPTTLFQVLPPTFCTLLIYAQMLYHVTLFVLTRAVHSIGNVDFAGSDSLLKSAEYAEFPSLQMYPAVAGAVVPIFNVAGVDDLVLTPLLLSQIFRQCKSGLVCAAGSVSHWNDPRIIQLNPQHNSSLNAAGRIKVIVRQDKSGTTEIWKNSLSAFEPAFAKQIGKGESNTWLNASVTMANLNEGVAATVLAVQNTIGYSVLAEARVLRLKMAGLKKESGNVVWASTQTISFAVMEKGADFGNNGDTPSRLTADIHNAKGTNSSCSAHVFRTNVVQLTNHSLILCPSLSMACCHTKHREPCVAYCRLHVLHIA